MNLQQLYYFRKLAEVQHYTEAAKALYITQPSLSDSIASLEHELSVSLFQKKGRGVQGGADIFSDRYAYTPSII